MQCRTQGKQKGREKLPCLFLADRKIYFLSSFFAPFLSPFLSLFFAPFFPSLPSPFFISSFFIGCATAWNATTAKPLDTAKTAATNSDMSFFIQYLLSLSVIRMIRSPETRQPRGILAYIVESAKDSPSGDRTARRVSTLARIGK